MLTIYEAEYNDILDNYTTDELVRCDRTIEVLNELSRWDIFLKVYGLLIRNAMMVNKK